MISYVNNGLNHSAVRRGRVYCSLGKKVQEESQEDQHRNHVSCTVDVFISLIKEPNQTSTVDAKLERSKCQANFTDTKTWNHFVIRLNAIQV